MNNQNRHGRGNHSVCGNRNRCQGNNCGGRGRFQNFGQQKGQGRKRELFLQKYNEYLESIDLPEFKTDAEYIEWASNTEEGRLHEENIKRINEEVDAECPWGGKRENSGRRKECIRKIPYTRRISADTLDKLKKYALEHNITETEALEKAISKL